MNRLSEQRKFPRFNYSIPIKYRPRKDVSSSLYTVSRDISIGGMKILTHSFLPRGTVVRLEVKVPRAKVINALANVVWSSRISHSEQYLSGLMFSQEKEEDRDNISRLVNYALRR